MAEDHDWSGFYEALCSQADQQLEGVDDETREIIGLVAGTDSFWSDGMQSALAEGAGSGEMRQGVLATLELWRENVLSTLSEDFGIDLDWAAVTIDPESSLIGELVRAATPA